MFNSIKVYAGLAITVAFSVLLAMFKYKSSKLEETKLKLKDAKAEIKVERAVKASNDKSQKEYMKKLSDIGTKYDMQEKEVYKNTDAPLSPSLLERLRNKQGVGEDSNITPS